MIKTNLSTRPFYNEAAVHLWLALIAIVAVSLTIVNVQRLLYYSSSDTELATRATRDEQRAVQLRADAARLRGSVDAAQVETASTEAREANDLIDRRTFSWTELFNRFEATLPADVRITSLRQNLDRVRGIVLTIVVLARNVDDVNQFMENLSATGAFGDVLATEERVNPDNGELEVLLQAVYRPSSAAPPAPSAGRGTP
jgi:Tfp pilus assembly protein PilN